MRIQDFPKRESNNTKNNETKINDTNPILSEDVETDDRKIYREILFD